MAQKLNVNEENQEQEITFSQIYDKTEGLKDPLNRTKRDRAIAAEFQKYVPNMDIKSRRPRPRMMILTTIVVVVGMISFIAWRIYQGLYLDPLLAFYGFLVGFVVVLSFFCSYFRYKDPYEKARKNPKAYRKHPLVSVIIATKNERFIIYDCAYSCLNSTYKNLEVVIVNDGSDDEYTGKAIDELVSANPGRVFAKHLEKNEGKRYAMRHGVYMARGEIVVFLDSDTIVERDAIRRLVLVMNDDPEFGAVTGYCRALNAQKNWLTKMQDAWYHGAFSISKEMEAVLRSVSCCSGILSAYRMEALKPCIDKWAYDIFLGIPFMAGDDRQLTGFVVGGSKYTLDKNLKQWKAGYCESAISISETPTKLLKFVNQQVRWMQSWTRCFIFTAPWYWRGRHPLATMDYYIRMILSYMAPLVAVNCLIIAPITGHWDSMYVYILGITALSMIFAMDFKMYNPKSGHQWVHRVTFTFLSVSCLYFLLYYSVYSIKKNSWLTR